eukprot:2477875-Prymnesium_polylepis.1
MPRGRGGEKHHRRRAASRRLGGGMGRARVGRAPARWALAGRAARAGAQHGRTVQGRRPPPASTQARHGER